MAIPAILNMLMIWTNLPTDWIHIFQPATALLAQGIARAPETPAPGLGAHGDEVIAPVLEELRTWFGDDVASWRHLHTATVAYALPALDTDQPVMQRTGARRLESGVVVCGDYLATPSIQGAMSAGRRAAELVLEARAST